MEMMAYYLIPVVFIIAGLAYSAWARKRLQNMSPEEAAEKFHQYYAGYFELEENEKLVGLWTGVEFQGARSAARNVVGEALNTISDKAVGISTYVPSVQIGLTSRERVLISREYSDLGERDNFQQICAFGSGTRAISGNAAYPNQNLGKPPKNRANPRVKLEFVHIQSSEGEGYDAWVSPQGSKTGQTGFVSILQILS